MKINFGTDNSALSGEEYILDSGKGYSTEQGYGWVTQDSLDDATATPINISANTRDRNSAADQSQDSLIHLQYPGDLPGIAGAENPVRTPSAWEYDLENGTYQVTVSVGDAEYTDSNHVINIEGESAIAGFQPTSDELFTEVTTTVEVTDGKLTIDAIGGENTKLNFVEIAAEDGTDLASPNGSNDSNGNSNNENGDANLVDPIEAGDSVSFSFGSADENSVSGVSQETGAAYDGDRGYGWVTEASLDNPTATPIDVGANVRDRGTDSLIHLQYPEDLPGIEGAENPVRTPSAWEYDVKNGTYQVTVKVGDSAYTDSNHVINIEGESAIAGFQPTADELFTEVTTDVEVTDGKLTIDAIGGENTKLSFVEIAAKDDTDLASPNDSTDGNDGNDGNGDNGNDNGDSDSSSESITSSTDLTNPVSPVEGDGVININFGTGEGDSASGFTQDTGEAYDTDRGYGWVTQDSAGTANPTPIDVTANGRDRDTLFTDAEGNEFQDSARDSLIHLQYPTGAGIFNPTAELAPAAWEYDLANGEYEVTVGVGDPDYTDSNHVINVEGENLISGFAPAAGSQGFAEGSSIVEVTDGKLTIDAIGGDNTKINYISIVPVDTV
ncbi:MAG: hypothetical protein RLZZ04_1548 [Cyanobacteriota bacterium]|jgi:hypothetical protein